MILFDVPQPWPEEEEEEEEEARLRRHRIIPYGYITIVMLIIW